MNEGIFAPNASIVLVSIRGTGRSTLGVLAASALGFRLINTADFRRETTGLSRWADAPEFGNAELRLRESRLLKTVLDRHPTGSVIVCGPESVDRVGQQLLRAFALTHPVIYIMRDPEAVSRHLEKCPAETVSRLMELSAPTFRRLSGFEYYNISDAPAAPIFDNESGLQGSASLSLTLKKVQRDFLHFLRHIRGRDTMQTSDAQTVTSLIPLEKKHYTYALQLPLEQAEQWLARLEDSDCTADAVELIIDAVGILQTSPNTYNNTLDPCLATKISRLIFMIRRNTQLPVILHVQLLASDYYATAQPSSIPDSMLHLYIELLMHGLRLAPEYLTVELQLNDDLIKHVTSSKGHTKVIGHFFDAVPRPDSWDSPARHSVVTKAIELGCDLVRVCQPATSDADNIAVQRFLKMAISSKNTPPFPVIAYNTGSLGRSTCFLNAILSPVTDDRLLPPSPGVLNEAEQQLLLTAQESQKALYASFMLTPMQFGIFGNDVLSSLSPTMHNTAFKLCGMAHTYRAFQSTSLRDFAHLAQSVHFGGASITAPFKQEVLPLVDYLSPDAQAIGAVNTVIPLRSTGRGSLLSRNLQGPVLALYGENTDWIGIHTTIQRHLSPVNSVKSRTCGLVLGAGGMAHAAVYSMVKLGVPNIYVVNRTLSRARDLVERFKSRGFSSLDGHSLPSLRGGGDSVTTVGNSRPQLGYSRIEAIPSLATEWDVSAELPIIIVSCISTPEVTLPASWLRSRTGGVVVELSYNSRETPLLRQVRELKRPDWNIVHGLQVLPEQGISQFELFTGRKAPENMMRTVVLQKFKN